MTARFKYPRTPHLPFSLGRSQDDRVLTSCEHFVGAEVVVSLKMDGENTTLYRQGTHARSLDSRHHPSRDWLKQFHSQFGHQIPDGWRICGENLYAQHTLGYDDLPSYFLGFSAWDAENRALSWQDTLVLFSKLGIVPVPVLFEGPFNLKALQQLAKSLDTRTQEGLVVRKAAAFPYEEFGTSVAKWVRKEHVQTDRHWQHGAVIPNKLAKPSA